MEKHPSFVSDLAKESPAKSPDDHILDEIREDTRLFPESVRDVILGKVAIKDTPHLRSVYDRARNQWWQNKYGFPYTLKAARNEIITRKYAQPAELAAAKTLQEDLLDAYEKNDDARMAQLRQNYLEQYPDQLEGVEALFGLRQFFADQSTIDTSVAAGQRSKEREHLYQNITEYNFLLTDFIRSNSVDKPFLQKFWAVLETAARRADRLKMFQQLQRAIVTQVATGKIFEKIGQKTRLSHPSEDAFKAIDLWTESAAIQIKGTQKRQAGFLKTDTISFPGIEVTGDDAHHPEKTYHINSHLFHKA